MVTSIHKSLCGILIGSWIYNNVLPEPLPRGTDFKIRILVHYDILGIMRPGGVYTFEVIGHLSSEPSESYGGYSNCSDQGVLSF